jgi:hypothetical protein
MIDRRAELAESAVLERSKARESNRLLRIGDDGIPYCSYEACAQYDGKRCRELGHRPASLCEPQIADMARDLAAYRAHYVTKKSADLMLQAALIELDRATQQVVANFDEHAKKAGIVDLWTSLRERLGVSLDQLEAVFEAALAWRENALPGGVPEQQLIAAIGAARKERP